MRFPDVAGGVEDCEASVEWSRGLGGCHRKLTGCYYEEEEGDGVEKVGHGLGS